MIVQLWNMTDKQFKNIVKKDLAWQLIGLLVNEIGYKTIVVFSQRPRTHVYLLVTNQQMTTLNNRRSARKTTTHRIATCRERAAVCNTAR